MPVQNVAPHEHRPPSFMEDGNLHLQEEGLLRNSTITLHLPGSGHLAFPANTRGLTPRNILERLSRLAPGHVNPIRRMFQTGEFIDISLSGINNTFVNLTLQERTSTRSIQLRLEEGRLTISFENIEGTPSVQTLNAIASEVENRFCYYRFLNRISTLFQRCTRRTAID